MLLQETKILVMGVGRGTKALVFKYLQYFKLLLPSKDFVYFFSLFTEKVFTSIKRDKRLKKIYSTTTTC